MKRTLVKWATVAATVGVSVFFGYFAVRDVDWSATWTALRHSNYWWLLPALAAFAISTFLRAVRWRSLFRREQRPALGAVTKATLIGLFFNNILPARAGEAARIVALKSYGGVSRAESTATIVVERVLDVLCLVAVLFVLSPWLPHVRWLRAAGIVALVAFAVTFGLVALALYLRRRPHRRVVHALAALPFLDEELVDRLTASVAHGFEGARRPSVAIAAIAWTLASWLVLGLSFWFLMIGFHLHLSVLAGMLVVVAIALSFIIPAAPGGVGVFEAAGLAATRAYGIPKSEAFAYVFVLHAMNFVPYIAVGIALLAVEAPGGPRRLGRRFLTSRI